MPIPTEEFAPAKINLTLQVTGRRDDGYHQLDSLVAFADSGDHLQFTPADGLDLAVTGPFAAALADEPENLVLRAARALQKAGNVRQGAAITLEKHLPVASGIGGGSADAAAALRGLSRLWGLALPPETLTEIALALGADLPVCLESKACLMRGIGAEIAPLAALPPLPAVLVNPGRPLSTASVFKARQGPFSQVDGSLPPEEHEALLTWLQDRPNDLQAAALRVCPEIAKVPAALAEGVDCRLARMSGSGATFFGLYDSADAASAAAGLLRQEQADWWVMATTLR